MWSTSTTMVQPRDCRGPRETIFALFTRATWSAAISLVIATTNLNFHRFFFNHESGCHWAVEVAWYHRSGSGVPDLSLSEMGCGKPTPRICSSATFSSECYYIV